MTYDLIIIGGGVIGFFMLALELRVWDIQDIVFPHPAVSEILKEAVLQL
jgi:hypothetical protein